jgi:hypothetical protein
MFLSESTARQSSELAAQPLSVNSIRGIGFAGSSRVSAALTRQHACLEQRSPASADQHSYCDDRLLLS